MDQGITRCRSALIALSFIDTFEPQGAQLSLSETVRFWPVVAGDGRQKPARSCLSLAAGSGNTGDNILLAVRKYPHWKAALGILELGHDQVLSFDHVLYCCIEIDIRLRGGDRDH